ncbi:hypothetical protein D0T50_07310 [Bacteroides sp. 214]|uniref:hypothetical protein n=1 Tax=Bacteroides sp. 214 TaxID=2302935 RepID=UPI0013D32466|nr:hypothetical protein [Bacteroides sp. 214]NDW12695.1 hypothetical protein [Bacteroides sp. 214]
MCIEKQATDYNWVYVLEINNTQYIRIATIQDIFSFGSLFTNNNMAKVTFYRFFEDSKSAIKYYSQLRKSVCYLLNETILDSNPTRIDLSEELSNEINNYAS